VAIILASGGGIMSIIRSTYMTGVAAVALGLAAAGIARAGDALWTHTIDRVVPAKKGGAETTGKVNLWVAPDCKTVRGLIFAGKTLLEGPICRDAVIRKAAAEKGLGILFFDPALDALFTFTSDSPKRLDDALKEMAAKSGHPELPFVPYLTIGHSTGGIFCRNVAYWKPERVIGILHIKSGNFQDHIPDKTKSLAGVPLMAINGEFEEYGPAGGDLKMGLRSEYSLNSDAKTKQNQTQWVMIRMQMVERRRKNPDNLMSLVVHRGRGHTGWDGKLSDLCAIFIRAACDARLPKDLPDGKREVACRPLKAESGWLTDADIKDPKHPPAPYNEFKGDKKLAFWHVSKEMAEVLYEYHKGPWPQPDPTAGQPPEKRWAPPAMLQDPVDGPSGGK
jgi:hypothetical protein